MDELLKPYVQRLRELAFVHGLRMLRGAHAGGKEIEVETEAGAHRFVVVHKRSHLGQEMAEHLLREKSAVPSLLSSSVRSWVRGLPVGSAMRA